MISQDTLDKVLPQKPTPQHHRQQIQLQTHTDNLHLLFFRLFPIKNSIHGFQYVKILKRHYLFVYGFTFFFAQILLELSDELSFGRFAIEISLFTFDHYYLQVRVEFFENKFFQKKI